MSLASNLFLALIFAVLLVVVVTFLFEAKTKIVPAPTLPWLRRKMISLLQNYRKKNEALNIAELGCGWGGLAFAFAHAFPNAQITGYEISPFPLLFSKTRQMLSRKKVRILARDFFKDDLSAYDVIVCYLAPVHLKILKDKLRAELKPGTIIICNAFPIPDWEPAQTEHTKVFMKIPVFVYRV